jgi:hypothetical protein
MLSVDSGALPEMPDGSRDDDLMLATVGGMALHRVSVTGTQASPA